MSLIHEALKKAEQQRQLGEPPTLASPFGAPRQRRSMLPVILPLIGVALLGGWWILRPAPSAPAAVASQASDSVSGTTPANRVAASGPSIATTPADSSAAERRPNSTRAAPETIPAMSTPPIVTAPRGTTLPRGAPPVSKTPTVKEIVERESEPRPAGANPLAPGEAAPQALSAKAQQDAAINDPQEVAAKSASKRAQGEAPVVLSAAPFTPAPSPPTASPNTAKMTEAASLTKSQSDNSKNSAIDAAIPNTTAAPFATTSAATTTSGATLANPAQPGDHTPMYWELPLNVRKDLPALKLTMHVYSNEPKQRFVVLNGNRQVEGDDLGAEVKLSEIRADGVVLEFHGQRFLVPRGGS